jgi:hypothetical protein
MCTGVFCVCTCTVLQSAADGCQGMVLCTSAAADTICTVFCDVAFDRRGDHHHVTSCDRRGDVLSFQG